MTTVLPNGDIQSNPKIAYNKGYDKGRADGAMEFAKWLEGNGYLNWVGEGNDVNSMSAEEALAEWQKGTDT